MAGPLLFQSDPDIRLAGTEIYLDPAEPRKLGIISHGHSDHIGRGRRIDGFRLGIDDGALGMQL